MSDALLIIDVQVGLISGLPVWRGDALVERIAGALGRARAAGLPVLFVQHDGEPGSEVEQGTTDWAIDPRIAPLAGEPVIHKRYCDAFCDTELDAQLKRLGIRRLLVLGCMTQYCIDTSCRRAVSAGYDVLLAEDGHGTVDWGGLTAEQIIRHHNIVLNGLDADGHRIQVVPMAALPL